MLRRWIIRSLFLVPLVCVVAVWVTSYFGTISVHRTIGVRAWTLGSVSGMVVFLEFQIAPSEAVLWIPGFVPHMTAKDWGIPQPMFEFYFGSWPGISDSFGIVFPLWLPTLLLLGLNWLVWRKTRQRAGRGAFPVEPTKKTEG